MTDGPTPQQIRRALARAERGAALDPAEAEALLAATGEELDRLCAAAAKVRDAGLVAAGRPAVVTYSPKVFIPVTKLCRDRCHYCTFVETPAQAAREGRSPYLSPDEILDIARQNLEALGYWPLPAEELAAPAAPRAAAPAPVVETPAPKPAPEPPPAVAPEPVAVELASEETIELTGAFSLPEGTLDPAAMAAAEPVADAAPEAPAEAVFDPFLEPRPGRPSSPALSPAHRRGTPAAPAS